MAHDGLGSLLVRRAEQPVVVDELERGEDAGGVRVRPAARPARRDARSRLDPLLEQPIDRLAPGLIRVRQSDCVNINIRIRRRERT